MLGHDDVAVDAEAMALSDLFQCGFEDVFCVLVREVGEAVKAAEGDEVIVALGSVTLQTCRHPVRVADGEWFGYDPSDFVEFIDVVVR